MQVNKLIVGALVVLLSPAVFAQQPAAKTGWLRFWNMLPKGGPVLELIDTSSGPEGGGSAVAGNVWPCRYNGYRDLPPQRYKLSIFRKGDRKEPLGTVDLPLVADQFSTIVVHGDVRRPTVELFDDTITDKEKEKERGSLTVRNYFPGLTVAITAGQQNSGPLPYDGAIVMSDLPLKNFPARIVTKLPSGVAVDVEVEIPLKASLRRATLLVIPDSYGRFRPRVVGDAANL